MAASAAPCFLQSPPADSPEAPVPTYAEFNTEDGHGHVLFDGPLDPASLDHTQFEFRVAPNLRPAASALASDARIDFVCGNDDPFVGDPVLVYTGLDPLCKGTNGQPVQAFTIPAFVL